MNSQYKQRYYAEPTEEKNNNELQRYSSHQKEMNKGNIYHDAKNKSFFIDNVDFNNVHIEAPSLNYKVFSTQDKNKFKVEYDPQEKEHDVSVYYNEGHVEGSPFRLAPTMPTVNVDEVNKIATFRNVKDFGNLAIKSSNLNYTVYSDKNDEHTFHMKFETNDGIHDVDASYNGHPIPGGIFRLVPEAAKDVYEKHGVVKDKNGHYCINYSNENTNNGIRMFESQGKEAEKHQLMAANVNAPMNRMIRNNEEYDVEDINCQNYKPGQTLYAAPPVQSPSKSYY